MKGCMLWHPDCKELLPPNDMSTEYKETSDVGLAANLVLC